MVALEISKLFHALSAAELEPLRQSAQSQSFNANDVIFKEGDPGSGLFVVQSGAVQISAMVGPGERRVLSRLGPGDFFGEMAVLDNEPRSATASAENETTLCFIPRQNLLAALEASPKMAVSLVREFSLRMRDFNRQYIQEVLQAERLTLVGRFARSIVHDFKNPLNVIGIAAEMGCADNASPTARSASKGRIRKQVDRLGNMINELLEFTRGSQSSHVLAQTDYAPYVHQLVEELRPEAAVRNVTIEFASDPPLLSLLIDPSRMTHVFYNLIHNAVDAMPEGGKIFLRFSEDSKMVVTEVEDTGQGIPPEIAARLFEAFATFGKAQGTGLGLSICKRIIVDHRGEITVRSEPGRGATFKFTLPKPE